MRYKDLTDEQKEQVKVKMRIQNAINLRVGLPIFQNERDYFEKIKEDYDEVFE